MALRDGAISTFEVHPDQAGLPTHPFEAIQGGAPAQNAVAFRALMDGQAGAYRDAVCLNAGAALVVAGKAADLREGARLAAEAIDSGGAREKIAALARATAAG